jgi:hypothetical protein
VEALLSVSGSRDIVYIACDLDAEMTAIEDDDYVEEFGISC